MGLTIESVDDANENHIKRELNILIIGGTGVGKSTFINSTINYLKFENIEEALKCEDRDSLFTIPSYIKISSSERWLDFEVGKVGKLESKGESVTKSCTTYSVELPNDLVINLIDTPGIGDTRGIAQDKENLENILDELAEIKLLHGIVFLLDPKESRLTTQFKYCINELLTQLHSSARNNFYFIFTKSRSEMYRPGIGLSILKEHFSHLKSSTNIEISTDQRVFCVDNESFQYLMAKKFTNDKFDERDEECYSNSWKISTQSVLKLFESIEKNEPHKVSESICINTARVMINKTQFPLSQCIDRINKKEQSLSELNKQLIENEKNYGKLKDLLLVTSHQTETFPLPYPFIFCYHAKCRNDTCHYEDKIVEGNICDNRNKKLDRYSILWFSKCFSFWGNCENITCGHTCSEHKIEVNGTIKKKVQVEDIKVKEEMYKTKESMALLKDEMIKKNEMELKVLKSEKEELGSCLLKFSIFLHHYSLVPVNHDFKEYIQTEIDENKNNETKNEKKLKNLNKLLDEYNSYQQCLDHVNKYSTEAKSTSIPTPDSIFEIIHKIENLPITSEYFQKALNTQKNSNVSLYQLNKKKPSTVIVNSVSNLVNSKLKNFFGQNK